ncbi:MAG: serine/threonine protein kinase [Zoogloeaceae bacterium]|nr:serine/threonine protein kinase [Zoogloeaceae bacterium]
MSAAADTPFSTLTPDHILSALEGLGVPCDGRLLALNSYENRVWQVGVDGEDPAERFRVAKFYRPGRWSEAAILEEHGFLTELADDDLPVVPPLQLAGRSLHFANGFPIAVFPRRGGRAPELDDPDCLRWMGRLLGRIHQVGRRHRHAHRVELDIHRFGIEPRQFVMSGTWLPPELAEPYASVSALALDEVHLCFDRAGDTAVIRLHGDCHAGNVLWTDAGPHFVDFDDTLNGPPIQDLWMLLSGDDQAMARQLDTVLEGYECFAHLDPRELHLIEALRTLRLLHYSAWLARRWADPAFPAAFPWFASPRYWQDQILALREQVALMAESPLVRLMT